MPDKDAGPLHGGRAAQARQLLGLLRSARSGDPSLAVISGRKGMGKTSLLETFLGGDDVANQDTTVLRAAGAAWEQHFDFGVIQQLLTKCPHGGREQDSPESGQQADSVERYSEALLATMNTVTGSGRTLILGLSDIHVADTASLQALLYALRRVGRL